MKREVKVGAGVIISKQTTKSRLGWSCEATVDGVPYEISLIVIRTGTPQPDTWGAVRRVGVTGRSLWEDRVPAAISPKEILSLAGLLDETTRPSPSLESEGLAANAQTPGVVEEGGEPSDPLAALRGKFKIEESRLTARHGARVRSGLWTVTCDRCATSWTLQVRVDGQAHPDTIQRLLGHHCGEA
jgi:hypothetical protein